MQRRVGVVVDDAVVGEVLNRGGVATCDLSNPTDIDPDCRSHERAAIELEQPAALGDHQATGDLGARLETHRR